MHHLHLDAWADTIVHKHEEKLNGKNKILDPPQNIRKEINVEEKKKKKDNINTLKDIRK